MVKSDKMQQTSSPGCSLLCLTHLSCFFLNKTCQCRAAEWGLEMMCAELRQGLRGQRGEEMRTGLGTLQETSARSQRWLQPGHLRW